MACMKTFSDYLIKPKYSEVESRSLVNTSWSLGNIKLDLPIISSNMKTITGAKMAIEMYRQGCFGILHRFSYIHSEDPNDILNENLKEFNEVKNAKAICGISLGVQEFDKTRFEAFVEAGAKIFCVDVAHGHHIRVKRMLQFMNSSISAESRSQYTFIAGNVSTIEGAKDIMDWGADVVKVGIGPGSRCITRKNTGVGVPQLDCLRQIREAIPSISMISDGGVKDAGDFAKALIYTDYIMAGSIFAGTSETPGHVFKNDKGSYYKVYGGSASGESKGRNSFVEGVMTTVPFIGKAKYIVREMKQGLQSACSYVNANNLREFKLNAELIEVSGGGRSESKM